MQIDRKAGLSSASVLVVFLVLSTFFVPSVVRAESDTFDQLFSRSTIRARILELLFDSASAPTEELRDRVAPFPRYFMPRSNDVHVSYIGNEDDVENFGRATFTAIELSLASVGFQVSDEPGMNILITVDQDPAEKLLSALTPTAKNLLLAPDSGFRELASEITNQELSCSGLQLHSRSGALEGVYILVKTGADNTHYESCIVDMVPMILGLHNGLSSLNKSSNSSLPRLILNTLAAHILYSLPEVRSGHGAIGVSEEMIDEALDRFYESISDR